MTRALAIALVLLGASAPAAAAAGPVDFSMTPPQSALRDAGVHGVRSAALRPPRTFDLLGFSWRGRPAPDISVRARSVAGRWSPWRPLAASPDGPDPGSGEGGARGVSDPAWAGRSDLVQFRLSRRVAGLRLHFVAVPRMPGAVRAAQAATPGAPPIVPRSGWDAAACGPPRAAPFYGQVKMAFIHHTETLNGYSRSQSPSIVLGICRFHRDTRGWDDIGYNFLVDRFGTIFEGRAGGIDMPVRGAQAGGWNDQSTGIAVIGNQVSQPASAATLDSIAKLIRWKLPLEGVPTAGTADVISGGGPDTRYRAGTEIGLKRISGHRDADSTTCPGNALYRQLGRLRQMVGDVQPDPALAPTQLSFVASPGVTDFPQPTLLRGTLVAAGGSPVANARVSIRSASGPVWREIATATTDGFGNYAAPLALRRGALLEAFYTGDGGHRRAFSVEQVAQIRPQMTLGASAATVAPGAPLRLTGTIAPAKAAVGLVIAKQSSGRFKQVAAASVKARGGTFARTLRLGKPGTYRAYARFRGDGANAAARSASVSFTVG